MHVNAPSPAGEAVSRVLEEYSQALRVPVCLDVPRGRAIRARRAHGLWLHPFAVPASVLPCHRAAVHGATLPTICGFPVPDGRRRAWRLLHPQRWGHPLEDAEGHVVGLQRLNSLYLLFDLLGQEPALSRLLTRAVLDLALRSGRLLPAPSAADCGVALRLQAATEAEALRSGAWWPSDAWSDRAPEGTSDELDVAEANLHAAARQMRRLERRLIAADRRLAQLEHEQSSLDALGTEVDRLAALPEVTDVRLGEEVLYLFTAPLSVEYHGSRFHLGRFRIDLHLDGRLYLHNLTQPYHTYDHPHVQYGSPCLGNIRDAVQDLMARREYAAVATVLLRYLQTVNDADWRMTITRWPALPAARKAQCRPAQSGFHPSDAEGQDRI